MNRFRLFVSDISELLWKGLAAGAIAGAVGGGLGSRLAMGITALMSSNVERLNRTENDAIVGDITFGGTLALIIVGAIAGILGGMAYVALKPWLPQKWPLAGLAFSAILLAMAGSLVIVGDNRDFRIFGSATVNVLMFALLFPLYGLLLAFLTHRMGEFPLENWYARAGLLLALTLLYVTALVPLFITFISPEPDSLERSESILLIGMMALAGLGILLQAMNARFMQVIPLLAGCVALVGLYFDVRALMDIF